MEGESNVQQLNGYYGSAWRATGPRRFERCWSDSRLGDWRPSDDPRS